jgi:hypothetical protein
MRKIIYTLLFVAVSFTAHAKDFYVAVNGNDTNPGTFAKPFASIQKAIAMSRKYPEQSVIFVRGGNYYVAKALTFTAIDSRKKNGTLTIKPYAKEIPILSSDKVLKLDWKAGKNGVYYATIKDTNLKFDQLFINGKRMVMARYPNYTDGVLPYGGAAADAIAPERIAKWKNPAGAFIHAMHNSLWGDLSYKITGKDNSGKLIMEGGWQNNRPSAMHAKYRFVENVKEEFDAENEWYYDNQTHQLYLMPEKGLNLSTALVQAPQLESLITFNGTVDKPVEYIMIEGLTLTHTLRTFMKTNEPLLRSDWTIYRGAAIFAEHTAHINITNCDLQFLGGNAILFSKFNQYNTVSGCHLKNVGASGISFVGDPAAVRSPSFKYQDFVALKDIDTTKGPKGDNYPRFCKISDNLIHQIGEVEKQTAGVQISMSRNIEVLHNTIYDVPRAGINCNEGTWGGHYIAYNDVFNTVLETGDHGAFNSWGRDRFWHPKRETMDSLAKNHPELILLDAIEPTMLFNNRFRCDNGWDIDLDDGSSNYIIKNNVCLNGGIKLREGFNRVVENNIMINNSFHPHVWFKNSHDKFEHNIVGSAYQPIRVSDWGTQIDYNFFPDQASLDKARLQKADGNSTYGDALFTDAASGNFTLKATSPALSIGIKSIDMNFGVVSPRLKKLAKQVTIPTLVNLKIEEDKEVDFFNLKVKNIQTLAEQSATGMPDKNGVLVTKSNLKSILYPLVKENDVILYFADQKINNVKDLFDARLKITSKKTTTMTVFRDQKAQEITVDIK